MKNKSVGFTAQTQELKDFFVEMASVMGFKTLSILANKAMIEYLKRHCTPKNKERLEQLLVAAVTDNKNGVDKE